MSNTYMGFSEEIEKLSPEEIKWVYTFLSAEDDEGQDQWCTDRGLDPKTFDEYDRENWPGFCYRVEKGSNNLWLYCEEGFNPDTLAHFVQQFLKKWRPHYVFSMTYASWCDKPLIGAFGGGWMAISAYACIDSGCHSVVELAAKQLHARVELETQSKVEAVSGKSM